MGKVREEETCTITAELEHETALAYLIDDGEQKVWVPKSKTTDNGDGTFTMPEWLANTKGLI